MHPHRSRQGRMRMHEPPALGETDPPHVAHVAPRLRGAPRAAPRCLHAWSEFPSPTRPGPSGVAARAVVLASAFSPPPPARQGVSSSRNGGREHRRWSQQAGFALLVWPRFHARLQCPRSLRRQPPQRPPSCAGCSDPSPPPHPQRRRDDDPSRTLCGVKPQCMRQHGRPRG